LINPEAGTLDIVITSFGRKIITCSKLQGAGVDIIPREVIDSGEGTSTIRGLSWGRDGSICDCENGGVCWCW